MFHLKRWFMLEKVVLSVNSNNAVAVKLYKNAGFVEYGTDDQMILMAKYF